VRVHQPGGHLMRQHGADVQDWSWRKTRRRAGLLWRLMTPYRRRAALSVLSLLTAVAVAVYFDARKVEAPVERCEREAVLVA